MKSACVALTFIAGANALSSEASTMLLEKSFEDFKITHNKKYESEEEHAKRFAIFEEAVEVATQRNIAAKAAGHAEVHGITKFSDLTEDEFDFYLGAKIDSLDETAIHKVKSISAANNTLTGSFSWYDKEGALTPVKDQAMCGSCWAFSATETIEAAWARAGNPLTEFSPQQLVSCDTGGQDDGCHGGLPGMAFEYVRKTGGLATETDYPYLSGETQESGTCTSPLPKLSGGTVSKWGYLATCGDKEACPEDSASMAASLQHYGPFSIAMDARQFKTYAGGIYSESSCSNLPSQMDHAVQVVGYNADAAEPYWIIRNSWGQDWGIGGLIHIAMGGNTCGIFNIPAVIDSI